MRSGCAPGAHELSTICASPVEPIRSRPGLVPGRCGMWLADVLIRARAATPKTGLASQAALDAPT